MKKATPSNGAAFFIVLLLSGRGCGPSGSGVG
jgi:hypothetical protein